MACFSPLKAICCNGRVLVVPRFSKDRAYFDDHSYVDTQTGEVSEWFDVPCGRCIGCRMDYARKWSARCVMESLCWDKNEFLTLTYDDEHLPADGSLHPDDFSAFIKRLRDRIGYESPIRFYGCGEYGSTTFRPHYHMIVFNLDLDGKKQFYKRNELGQPIFKSDFLDDIWKKGYCWAGSVTPQSCAYVARYVQKKAEKVIDYDALGVKPEFVRMSRNPGIGTFFFEKNQDLIKKYDKVILPDGNMFSPPRFFDKFYEENELELVKSERRRVMELTNLSSSAKMNVDEDRYMAFQKSQLESRVKALRRS